MQKTIWVNAIQKCRDRKFMCILLLLVQVGIFLQVPNSAYAKFESFQCKTRGPVNGDYVDVCVRVETTTGASGGVIVIGYGAMDARGPNAYRVKLEITALHIRRYYPVNGPEFDRIVSPSKSGYDYINHRTPRGFPLQCGYGYKAVMSYKITWANGQVTIGSNFYTPPGTTRWYKC